MISKTDVYVIDVRLAIILSKRMVAPCPWVFDNTNRKFEVYYSIVSI
jgi:hypothetical protein